MDIDTELLIKEVRKKPVLWDTSSDLYKNRSRKKEAWGEVCKVLICNFETKTDSEKIAIENTVMTRWKSVRDNFVRDRRKGMAVKSSTGTQKPPRYVYAEQLSFLTKDSQIHNNNISFDLLEGSIDRKPCRPPGDCQGGQLPENYGDVDFAKPAVPPMLSKKRKKPTLEEKLIAIMKSAQQEKKPQIEDEDTSFFASLLPSVRELNAEQKLQFRMQVLQILHNIKKKDCKMQRPIPEQYYLYQHTHTTPATQLQACQTITQPAAIVGHSTFIPRQYEPQISSFVKNESPQRQTPTPDSESTSNAQQTAQMSLFNM